MGPAQFRGHQRAKGRINGSCAINNDSHFIKKSPTFLLSSSSSTSSLAKCAIQANPQQPHPVIIYTHSPRIIHTSPRDFMALVQKLTGLSNPSSSEIKVSQLDNVENGFKTSHATSAQDNETSSSSIVHHSSCFGHSFVRSSSPSIDNIPFYNHTDSLFLMPDTSSSISSPTLEEDLNEFGGSKVVNFQL